MINFRGSANADRNEALPRWPGVGSVRRDVDMTRRTRCVAVATAVVLASGAVAACSSEHGQTGGLSATGTPGLTGTYTFVTGGQLAINGEPRPGGASSTTTWEITACGAGCSHVTSSLGGAPT